MKRANAHYLKTLLFALWALSALPGTASAWWNSEWTLRRKITLDTTDQGAAIGETIGTAPVLIRLHDGNFQFAAAKDDGSDLRFVAGDDKTALPYHIEKYDPLLGEAFVWVKVPDLKPRAQTAVWLYYGYTGSKGLKAEDAKASYDPDTVLVYHFAEHGAPAVDSTVSSNNAQNAGTAAEGSIIGTGLRLDGKNAITIPGAPSLAWGEGSAFTWSAWIKLAVLKPNALLYSRRDGAKAFLIGSDNGIPFVEVTGRSGTQRTKAGAPLAPNSWRHLAVVAEGSKITLYLDGEPCGAADATVPALESAAALGGDSGVIASEAAGFGGEVDELQISKVARPVGYLKLAAFSQGGEKSAKLLVTGEEEQAANWSSWMSTGYFGIIFKSLSVDGWVVIGILAVMAVISWFVMITKVGYLNAISKGNALFMNEWNHVASDLTVLDHGDAERSKSLGGRIDKAGQKVIRNASVYRIYHIGVEEIRHRLAEDKGADIKKVLSGRSIQAIRATLDGGLVRETQKVNRLIVLLTICISGGPFLGLLGTVVGVMITFASVAAAGEVNVNAIAPGIAAALLATVAGLAVAIPSLFGYNYILSRIKDVTADMHVFIDEFVTRMAEFYHEKAD